MYADDSPGKFEELSRELEKSDYIIIASRRSYGVIYNARDKFPQTANYYDQLFDGKLGYSLVEEFYSYPTLFGREVIDDNAEETFQVFDHPRIMIFKNQSRLNATQIQNLIKQ